MDTNFYNSKEHTYIPGHISEKNPVTAATSLLHDATWHAILRQPAARLPEFSKTPALYFVSPDLTGMCNTLLDTPSQFFHYHQKIILMKRRKTKR